MGWTGFISFITLSIKSPLNEFTSLQIKVAFSCVLCVLTFWPVSAHCSQTQESWITSSLSTFLTHYDPWAQTQNSAVRQINYMYILKQFSVQWKCYFQNQKLVNTSAGLPYVLMGDNNRLIALNHPVLQHLQQQQQQLRDSTKMEVGEGNDESSASAESDYDEVSESDT